MAVAFGRKDLEGNRQREAVDATAFAEKYDALPAAAERSQHAMMLGPTEPLLVDQLVVFENEVGGVARSTTSAVGSGREAFKEGCV